MDPNIGSAVPLQYWLTAAGGLAAALFIYFLRPRRKVVPKGDLTVSKNTGTPSDSTQCNGGMVKTLSQDNSGYTGIISPVESTELKSSGLEPSHKRLDHCEKSRDDFRSSDVTNPSFSSQENSGMKDSRISSTDCENSKSNNSRLMNKFVRGKGKNSDLENLASSAEELTLREAESSRDIQDNLDDLVDHNSDIRDIEKQLAECKQTIKDLEAEIDLEREGRQKAQNWTVLLEKELDAHISARRATDDKCSKLTHKLKETKRTLKHTQRRCEHLEKLVSQLSVSSDLSEINDSSLGDSVLSSPLVTPNTPHKPFEGNRELSEPHKEVESDSLEESDPEVKRCRRDSLEEPEIGRVHCTLLSNVHPYHSGAKRPLLGENPRGSQDSLDELVHNLENGVTLEEKVVHLDEFNDPSGFERDFDDVSDVSNEDEFLDEEEDELAGMDSDSCDPGLTREEADFELSKDIMEVIINNVQGDLSSMLCAGADEDSLSDLLPDNLAVMEEDEIPEEISFTHAEVSDESIGNTKRTKQFWEQIALDQTTDGTGSSATMKISSGASDREVSPEYSHSHYLSVRQNWERSYTPDSLHELDDITGIDENEALSTQSRDQMLGGNENSPANFASIRDHWDKVHQGKIFKDTDENDQNETSGQHMPLGTKIESMKQHWERAMEESPTPRSNSSHSGDSLERSTDFSELKHHWDSFKVEEEYDTTLHSNEFSTENNNNPKLPNFGEIKSQWEQKISDAEADKQTSGTNITEKETT